MFPFVGAPMFYSARRRKRKWTLVFCVEGAVAVSDVIGGLASTSARRSRSRSGGEVGGDEEEGDELEGNSGDGGEERQLAIDLIGRDDVDSVILLPSSSPVASTSTSLAKSKLKRRRRSSSLPMRGYFRKLHNGDEKQQRGRVPSHIWWDEVAVSTVECLLEHCAKWNFDTFLLNRLSGGHVVVALGCRIFQTYQFHRVFQLDWTALLLCLRLIENGYRDNPYHNSEHAADVAQAMHCFLQEPPLAVALTPLEKMACVLAAFGHDLYHPGVNQKFLEGSRHFLCPLYNNVSVLENFHWRCLVSVVKESSLFDNLSTENWKKMLNIFEVLILATDMQRQQEYLNQFKPYSERGGQPHLTEADERLFVMQILIKCADIANPCRPWMISKEWSFRASTEFFNQGDQERNLGLPVTNFCDRFGTSVPKIQSGFMEYVAQPLFADWDQYMRSPLSSFMLRNLRANCQNWNKTLREQVQQQQQQAELLQLAEQSRQTSGSSSPASIVGGGVAGARVSPQHQPATSAASSLEEMAELEMQKPDVLQKRRASSSAVPRSRSPRSSLYDQPRRVSLPVSTSGGATLWTASTNRRLYEAVSTSDIANAPVRLRLSHSDVAEGDDDEEEEEERKSSPGRRDDIEEGEEEDEEEEEKRSGACSGSGCGTPTPPPPAIIVSTTSTGDDRSFEGLIYSVIDKNLFTLTTTSSPHQQQRRYSEPVVVPFCPVQVVKNSKTASKLSSQKQQTDENGRLSNLMLLQRYMPRRGSLPMTQKELEDVQISVVPLSTRSNSSGPEPVPALHRAVDVS